MSDTHLIETCLAGETVFDGKLLKVCRDRVRLPDGGEAWREYIRHPGAVVVIPVLPDGRLLVERQFRYPVGQVFIEFPAGKIDPGEDLQACAERELLEETGYTAASWEYLGLLHPVIGYANEVIHIYLARDLVAGAAKLDEGEFLEVLPMALADLREAFFAGQITDAKTITCLYWAERKLAGLI
jgi:ADP-ribose pyrophosphatase